MATGKLIRWHACNHPVGTKLWHSMITDYPIATVVEHAGIRKWRIGKEKDNIPLAEWIDGVNYELR